MSLRWWGRVAIVLSALGLMACDIPVERTRAVPTLAGAHPGSSGGTPGGGSTYENGGAATDPSSSSNDWGTDSGSSDNDDDQSSSDDSANDDSSDDGNDDSGDDDSGDDDSWDEGWDDCDDCVAPPHVSSGTSGASDRDQARHHHPERLSKSTPR